MHDRPEKVFRIFIMASKPRGVLYVGMSSDLGGRAWKHREHVLVRHDDARVAMKRWRRDWKIELIERHNPTWRDLFPDVLRADGFEW